MSKERKIFSCGAIVEVEKKEPELVSKKSKHRKENLLTTSSKIKGKVTAIIVNFKTKDLTRQAFKSLRSYYPNLHIVLVDNCSNDESTEWCKAIVRKDHDTTLIINSSNIGHGPAMHKAIKKISTPYVFTLDSDCLVHKGGFLELMLAEFKKNPKLYAIGWRRIVDKITGVPSEWHIDKPPSSKFIPYIHPAAAVYDRKKYLLLEPFFNHGAPCLNNMRTAVQKGYDLQAFPILKEYITHLIAGTRRMYAGRWNPKTSEKPRAWHKNTTYPI